MYWLHRSTILLAFFTVNGLAQSYTISTIAGTNRLLDGNPATTAPLRDPESVVADAAGGFYIADGIDNRIRHVSAQGLISTFAGSGLPVFAGDRGKAALSSLDDPQDVKLDAVGNVYIADYFNNVVRRVSADGIINTIAGNGTPLYTTDGQATRVGLSPRSIAVDSQGKTLYIADDLAYRILKVDLTAGTLKAIAGTGSIADINSSDFGTGLGCRIGIVPGMTVDPSGNVFLADITNARVRKIDTSGNVSAVAGAGEFGFLPRNGVPAINTIMLPTSVAVDSFGNIIVADFNDDVIFSIAPATSNITLLAGNGFTGFSGDHGSPTSAELNSPQGLSISTADNSIYFADLGNFRIRKIQNGVITTVAGTDMKDGGPATSAFLNLPGGLAIDGNGRIVIADTSNFELRAFTTGGIINPFGQLNSAAPHSVAADAGGNFYVSTSDPAVLKISPTGSTAQLATNFPDAADLEGLAVDATSNVYVADYTSHYVRKVSPSGNVSIFAGNGTQKASGDNGQAVSAGMDPMDVAMDSKQNLYVADTLNNRIRKIAPDGTVTTVAGTGTPGYAGDGGLAVNALLGAPTGIAVDPAGNLYICDTLNAVVRRVTASGLITTIAGTEGMLAPASGDGGPATSAVLFPFRIAVDSTGNVYVSDGGNDLVRKLTPKIVNPASIKITGGNNQTGTTGTKLSAPLAVQVVDSTGAGVPGLVVSFAVSPAGAATVSPAITLNDGTATAAVTLGGTAGTVTVTASVAGVSSTVAFTVTVKLPISATAPAITPGGVVSSGLSTPAVKTLSTNALATAFGVNFAPAGTAKQVGSGDLVNGKLPTTFAGACVLVGTAQAPIDAVYPGQINFQVPAVASGNTTVQVITGCGTANSQTSNAEPVTIQAAAPEFFYFITTPNGHNPIAAVNILNGAYIGPPGLISGLNLVAAKPGDLLELFGTNFGATTPSFAPGEAPTSAAQVTGTVSITMGGVTLAASDILYVGVSTFAGLYQVNIRVPDAVPDGDQPLVLTISGVPSPSGGYITVAH